MKISEKEFQGIKDLITSSDQGRLPSDALVIRIAQLIVEYSDPEILSVIPERISVMIYDLIDGYKRDGEVYYYTSSGKFNHSDLVRQLIDVLDAAPSASAK